jgi:hypothetical protein
MWGSIAIIVAILIVGGLFYAYKGNNTNVASNTPPAAGMNAPAPMAPAKPAAPAPAPAPTRQ